HILNLDDYTFKSISKQDTQKLIIVQSHKQNHNNLIMANNEDSIVSTIKISDNKLAIQVYKSKSNLVIQNLIDYNYEIIEVKDL
ncbi:ABC transporter ATP-binding protein, partial [Staphylococcus equorum]